jgi:hypothetical protein
VDAVQISGDSAAADALEAAFDGTATGARLFGIDRLGTAAAVAAGTITLDAGAAYGDNSINGATVWGCGSTQGYCQFNSVASSAGDVLTLADNWAVTPSGTVTYFLFGTAASTGGGGGASAADVWSYGGGRTLSAATNITSTGGTIPITGARVDASVGAYQAGLTPLQPTVSGRTLDVTTTGGAGIDWANVEAPGTTLNLSGTSIGTATALGANAVTAAAVAPDAGTEIATAIWASGTRTLTAGTGIVLAKGVGVTGFNDLSGAQVEAEVTDALNALTLAEPAAKPTWGVSSLGQWVAWIGAWSRNEIRQTETDKILRNDANSATIATCGVTDDGTTLIVAECTP